MASVTPQVNDPAPDEARIRYDLPLDPRSGRRSVLILPDDLSESEADRIARFVASIAQGAE